MIELDAQLIDRIVRDVMARLGDGGVASAGTEAATTGAATTGPVPTSGLLLDEPVLTEATLAERIDGHDAITIGTRTVLTPTARDFLRQRGIAVERATSGGTGAGAAAKGHFEAIVVGEQPTADSALRAVGWNGRQHDCWKQATREAVGLTADGGAVVFAIEAAAVGCVANRNQAVRAAIVDDAHGVRAARAMIGPNMLVVDPTGKSFVDLRGILVEFGSGSITAPSGWED